MYNNTPHIPTWRLWLIHIVAKAVGVLVHVQGFPIGSRSKKYALQAESSWDRGVAELEQITANRANDDAWRGASIR